MCIIQNVFCCFWHEIYILIPPFAFIWHFNESKSSFIFYLTVIRAKISGEKIVSPSNSSSPYMKMIQYEIKMIKVRSQDSSNSCCWTVHAALCSCVAYVGVDHKSQTSNTQCLFYYLKVFQCQSLLEVIVLP